MFGPRVYYEYAQEPKTCTPYNIGVNAIFLACIPYSVVTALHDTHLELSLILGTAFTGGIILLGIVLRFLGGYRTWPFAFELFMLAVNAVLLGFSYPQPDVITTYLPFISNAFYATFALVSIMMTAPFTLQYVRQFVPAAAGTHDKLVKAAYATASLWCVTFITNTLLYLIPVCRGKDAVHSNALNLAFRIILPIIFVFLAAVFTRLWPIGVAHHLVASLGFDGALRKVVVNPLAILGGANGLPPPPLPPGPYANAVPPQPLQVQAAAT